MKDDTVIFAEGDNTIEYGETVLGPSGEYRPVAIHAERHMGVGAVNESEGEGAYWGLLSPKNAVASWRGMKILDQEFEEKGALDPYELKNGGFSNAYYNGKDGYQEEFDIPIDTIIERLEHEDVDFSVHELAREVAHERVPRTDMVEERFEQEDIYPEDIDTKNGWRDYLTDLSNLRNLITS